MKNAGSLDSLKLTIDKCFKIVVTYIFPNFLLILGQVANVVSVGPNAWKPPRRSHRARPQLAVTCWFLRRRHAQIVYLPASIE